MTLSDALWDVLDAFGHSEKCSRHVGALRGHRTHVRRDVFHANRLHPRRSEIAAASEAIEAKTVRSGELAVPDRFRDRS